MARSILRMEINASNLAPQSCAHICCLSNPNEYDRTDGFIFDYVVGKNMPTTSHCNPGNMTYFYVI